MTQPTWIGYSLNDRYQIKELLGQGGMSSVYRAYDPKLRRDVAVKIIHPHLSENPKFVRRFEEEAAAVAQLRHPNIRQVFDSDHDGDTYYMVLEFLPGATLKERINQLAEGDERMPLSEVVAITRQICSAIAYAHRNGVIHRDIKPSNVVISTQGEAVLTDFGIAKMVGLEEFTATGAVIGTAAYISPEQTQGERVDHRTDIYAIGVMLFEMVSGSPPFDADSVMSLMMKHINEPVPDLRQRMPTLHPGMIEIIEKAMAKDPAKRYQHADQIAADLDRLASPKTPARDPTAFEDTLHENTVPEETLLDEPVPDFFGTLSLTGPEPEEDKEAPPRRKRGIPRRFLELLSAAIGGGTIVVLALICLIAAAVLILPRIFSPQPPGLIPTIFDESPESSPVPPPAGDFTDLSGQPVSFDGILGEWVLLHNWQVDCPDCQPSMAELEAYYQNHQHQDFSVIGINAGDQPLAVESFLRENPVSYPVWLDPDQDTLNAFGSGALPGYILLNPDGTVHAAFQGPVDQDSLERLITPLLPE